MSFHSILALILTVLFSLMIVGFIILLGWFLIWKAFLSKFRLVRELLGQTDIDEQQRMTDHHHNSLQSERQSYNKTRKVRKD